MEPKDQWVALIEDYLSLARRCIREKRADGAIPHGYSVALLLLCAIDAMGHGLLPVTP